MLANPEWEQKQLFDLTQPSLKALSHILRHRELWPPGFKWFYGECETCAMGLAHQLWSEAIIQPTSLRVGTALDINYDVASHLFLDRYGYVSMFAITPEMVADRIDEYLNLDQFLSFR
jgi:hypothetical protein